MDPGFAPVPLAVGAGWTWIDDARAAPPRAFDAPRSLAQKSKMLAFVNKAGRR